MRLYVQLDILFLESIFKFSHLFSWVSFSRSNNRKILAVFELAVVK